MMASQGILTARGGLVSHAAVVARGWGTPAVVGAESIKISGRDFTTGDVTVNEGDVISLDGSSGDVVLGAMTLAAAEPPAEFNTILTWADAVRRGNGAPTPTPGRTQRTPAASAPRASGCVAPSTCSSPRTAFPWCRA